MFPNLHISVYYMYEYLENKPLIKLNKINIIRFPKYN